MLDCPQSRSGKDFCHAREGLNKFNQMVYIMLRKYLLFGGVVFILMHSSSFAYDGDTIHREINENATRQSALNNFLGDYLGFPDGIDNPIGPLRVWEWIREGGRTEDEFTRPVNHFHDPLSESWEDAGLPLEVSSLIWAQYYEPAFDPYGIEANIYSWARAREYYYQALTTGSEQGYALTFLSLGQIMHLLSDKAVPAHVRFDIHPPPYWKDPYESWTANPDNKDKINYTGIPVDSSIFNNYVASDSAPVPISALWDQDKYNMPNPDPSVTKGIIPNLAEIGLAEYANANFFSKDTIFDDYPHPAYADTNLGIIDWTNPEAVDAEDGVLDNRIYIYGDAGGTQNIRLAAMGYFSLDCIRAGYNVIGTPILDDKVHEDYAARLIPRAVGYSTALINYFFRGTLEISHPDQFVYSVIDGSNPHQFNAITANIRNTSHLTDGDGNDIPEEAGEGELIAVAKYRIVPDYLADLSNYPQNAAELQALMENVEFSYSVSQPLVIDPAINPVNADVPTEFTFDFTGNEIPAGITDLTLQVIFKGTLGNEIDTAIAVGMKDLNEPAHFKFANSTDEIVMNGVLTTADEIKNNAFLAAQVDWDSDGIFNEVVIVDGVNIGEPYIDPYDVSLQIGFSISDPQLEPNAVLAYPIIIDHLPAGRYASMIYLTDVAPGNEYWWQALMTRHFGESMEFDAYLFSFTGVYMHEGTSDWYYTPLEPADFVHRGAYQHNLAGEYYCVGDPCPYLGDERTDYIDMNPFPWSPLP